MPEFWELSAEELHRTRLAQRLAVQALPCASPEKKLLKRTLWDVQLSKEQVQDMVVAVTGWEVPDALEPKTDALVAQQINLVNSLRTTGKYLKVAIQRDVDLGWQFAEDDNDLELTDAERKKLEQLDKTRDKKRRASDLGPVDRGNKARYRNYDKSKDICRVCQKVGHWWSDPECKGVQN